MSLDRVEYEIEHMAEMLQHVERVGEDKAYRIAEEIEHEFHTLGEAVEGIVEHQVKDTIMEVHGVGVKTYNRIVNFFSELSKAFLYNLLFAVTVSPTPLP